MPWPKGVKRPDHADRMRRLHQEHPEWGRDLSARMTGRRSDGSEAVGKWADNKGYIRLSGKYGHPLADEEGIVREHRMVLFDAIGEGPHPCYWNERVQCGKTALRWSEIHVDHLNEDVADNRLENLVVSCMACNLSRQNPRHARRWA